MVIPFNCRGSVEYYSQIVVPCKECGLSNCGPETCHLCHIIVLTISHLSNLLMHNMAEEQLQQTFNNTTSTLLLYELVRVVNMCVSAV